MNGVQMLEKFRAPLHRLAVLMAVDKYGTAPDVADRIGEARLALVQAASEWAPAPKRATLGYFVRFALGQVAGAIRHGAGYAKDTSAAETSFVDLSDVVVARLEELSILGEEALWRLNNDTIVSTPQVIDLVMEDQKRIDVALARLRDEGVEATEEQLPVHLLRALTAVEEREAAPVPAWSFDTPEREPVARDLGAITVTRIKNDITTVDVIEGTEYTEMVNLSSSRSVMWDNEDTIVRYDDRYEDRRLSSDNLEPEDCIPGPLWRGITDAFLADTKTNEYDALDSLAEYWDRLDPNDGSKRRALFALAESIVSECLEDTWKRGEIAPAVLLYGIFRTRMGVETPGGWEIPELPGLSTLRKPAEKWLGKLEQSCWPSQRAGIKALALHRASPSEARSIEQEAYAASRYH